MSKNENWSLLYKITFVLFGIAIFTSGISISVSQACLFLSALLWIVGCYKNIEGFEHYKTGLEKPIGIFVIISIILAFFSPSILKNLLYVKDFWLISAFVLASSLIKSKKDIIIFTRILIITAIFQSIMGFISYYTEINFLNALKYGLDDPRTKLSMKFTAGFLGHHLTFGGYMLVLAIPILYLSFLKKKHNNVFHGFIIKSSSIMSLAVLLSSWSRSAIIALPFSVVPLFFKRKKYFIITSMIVLTITAAIFSYSGPSKDIIKNLFNESSQIRIQIWDNALRVWLNNPVFGSGGDNYHKEFKKVVLERPKENKVFKYFFPSMSTHAHNDYLNQLARKGLIGFIAFIYMLFKIFKYMTNNIKFIEDKFLRYLYLGIFGSYSTFLFASLFQCYYTDEEPLMLFWILIGLLASIVRVANKADENRRYI